MSQLFERKHFENNELSKNGKMVVLALMEELITVVLEEIDFDYQEK